VVVVHHLVEEGAGLGVAIEPDLVVGRGKPPGRPSVRPIALE
jgi:hypothetical protein